MARQPGVASIRRCAAPERHSSSSIGKAVTVSRLSRWRNLGPVSCRPSGEPALGVCGWPRESQDLPGNLLHLCGAWRRTVHPARAARQSALVAGKSAGQVVEQKRIYFGRARRVASSCRAVQELVSPGPGHVPDRVCHLYFGEREVSCAPDVMDGPWADADRYYVLRLPPR